MKNKSKFFWKLYIGIALTAMPIVAALIYGLVSLASQVGWFPILMFSLIAAMMGTGAWLMWSAAND